MKPARPLKFLRHNAIALIALFLALGGGYALAASKTTTIHGCVVKSTGELIIKKKCTAGESSLSFNQRGPAGTSAKPAPLSADGQVNEFGQVAPGQGLTVTHQGTGTYLVTITNGACLNPVVNPNTNYPVVGVNDNASPVAWVATSGSGKFYVYTGDIVDGTFALADLGFDVVDSCAS